MTDDEMSSEVSPDATTEADIVTTDDRLTVRRTFDATPERLFRAFTDPDELAAWYVPGEMTAEVNALEPDGELSVTMRAGEEVHAVEGPSSTSSRTSAWSTPGTGKGRSARTVA